MPAPIKNSFACHPMAEKWSKLNKVKPDDIARYSKETFYFDCDICQHQYTLVPANIKSHKPNYCPYCQKEKLCGNLSCEFCFINSFASDEKSLLWDFDNNDKSPLDYFAGSSKFENFVCDNLDCRHVRSCPINRVKGCPYCANKKLCGDDECESCFNKSFASHEKADLLVVENGVTARQILKKSSIYKNFKCDKCAHIWKCKPCKIGDCPFCINILLCDDDKCKICFEKSFASHEKSKYLVDPSIARKTFKGAEYKATFKCPDCSEMYVARIASVSIGTWCNCKKNKTETFLLNFLKENYDINTIRRKTFEWCKNKICLPFDFLIKIKIILELDGGQHFKQVSNWCDYIKRQKMDAYKMKCANKNGYTVIRLLQYDVWKNQNDWQDKLDFAIKMAIKEKTPMNILIGDIYHEHDIYKINNFAII